MDAKTRRVTPLVVHSRLRERVTAAAIAQAGIRHESLNVFLRERLSGTEVKRGALLAEPAIEGAAGYRRSGQTPADLSGTLLHPRLVAALAGEPGQDYRFDYPIYAHQIESWQALTAKEIRSVLVSSGTGSGKTECFLVPLLDDLAREAERSGRLKGVRALMLYPLNALIASQEERLRRWITPFRGDIRFALYNGQMMDARKHTRDRAEEDHPEQVLYRRTLRADPPPVLVTNNTMLEYMTIRKEDAPIVEASQGLLRWVVIDEAHSYVGSAAAEVSLLLRRVLQTFGVKSRDVRFVATSATIGGSDAASVEELRHYLADLAGVGLDQVNVILGAREPIELPPASSGGHKADVDHRSFRAHPAVQAFVRTAELGPLSMADAGLYAAKAGLDVASFVEAIALPGQHQDRPLLPMRVHQFIRAVPGLWSCLNPACSGERPEGWPFGGIVFQRADACPHCRGLLLELVSCSECGEPWLTAFDHVDHLRPGKISADTDEFAAASARETDDADDDDTDVVGGAASTGRVPVGQARLVGIRSMSGLVQRAIDPLTGALPERRDEGVPIWISGPAPDGSCPCARCGATSRPGKSGPLWPFRFGAPFLIQNAASTVLEGVSPSPRIGIELPAQGRQLLSFTDSRQGTARFAANIETLAERSFVRGFIYHVVQKALAPSALAPEERRSLEVRRAKYRQFDPAFFEKELAEIDAQLEGRNDAPFVSWTAMERDMAGEPTVSQWINEVWEDRDVRFQKQPQILARFLLLRELARRPRRANAAETLGFAKLGFEVIEKLAEARVPAPLIDRGFVLADWRDFLYYLVDSVLRAQFVLKITWDEARWLLPRQAILRRIVGPREDKRALSDVIWPCARAGAVKTNAVMLLEQALGRESNRAEDRSVVDDVLGAAWSQLQPVLQGTGSTLALDVDRILVSPVETAWLCPVTHRVLPRLVFGRTPYAVRGNSPGAGAPLIALRFPRLPLSFPASDADRECLVDFLEINSDIAILRRLGVWSNLHDRAAISAPYIRAEEHSAQQPPSRLRAFEQQFKQGEINLLACSTTMEMGVDIGSVEAVLNTNVPPSIANYRQRVGRAGRREQGFAFSLTFARDTPLDREAFLDPVKYLGRTLRAPVVRLDSQRIVQRHANALLLGHWFREAAGQLMRVKTGAFLGFPQGLTLPPEDEPPVAQFLAWLAQPSTNDRMEPRLARLTSGTALDGYKPVLSDAIKAFQNATAAFGQEWQSLRAQAGSLADDGKFGLEKQLRRMCQEPLLSELAQRSVLPAHGFPNAVVPLITDCAETKGRKSAHTDEEGETARSRRYDYPSRNAAIAIREYAPGAEIVVDGLVWQSSGVTLNWQRPAHEEGVREVQSIRWAWVCRDCGEADCAGIMTQTCTSCGGADIENQQFLEPAGFRVDWRSRPHAQADQIDYIAPEQPRISAREARWQPLLDPALGRGRATSDGLVFYHSLGRNRHGYRICLQCGRAAEEGDQTMVEHEALMPQRTGSWRCSGNDRTYVVTSSLALGHEILTDVAELQPAVLENAGAAWALASALRESLSRRLGIDPRELGLAVARRIGLLGSPTCSIFLHDQSAGGAGYAPRLFDDLAAILQGARGVLDCPMDCRTGCSACVLVADLYAQQTIIDRRAALAFVETVLLAIARPAPGDFTGPDCALSGPVADEIVRRGRNLDVAAIWIGVAFDLTTLAEPPLSTLFSHAAAKGIAIRVVMPKEVIEKLDAAARAGLRRALDRYRFSLWTAASVVAQNRASMVASARFGGSVVGFFSRDDVAATPGPGWGVGSDRPVVRMPIADLPDMVSVEDDVLDSPPTLGDRICIITADPGRPIRLFGTGFVSSTLKTELEQGGLWKPGRLASISYSDRYLKAPLPVVLMLQVASVLRDKLAPKGIRIPLSISTERLRDDRYGGAPFRISSNWQSEEDRTEIIRLLSEHLHFKCSYDSAQASHARKMTLQYDDGPAAIVLFDQGFGYWRAASSDRHDFRLKPAQQVKALLNASTFVAGSGESYFAVTRSGRL